ncbi:PKD domain-containing protein [Mucilaginibacter flavus]|uniref:PKD domain-containing protein n=1 Tax=Mucilaginibacter flavus TaxID=931504 RepID=UPI0025B2BACC|nr:PKD domain-containing protein [Mucilaginibacter flavus]MDN3582609.1 PKD domain-containing protein [Mucilaginibacter flavus]
MKLLRAITSVIILLCFAHAARAQGGFTNQGTEFWTVYMDHIDPPKANDPKVSTSQMDLYITADVNTTATVSLADGSFSQSYDVVAHQILSVAIPASAFIDQQGISNKGIHITSLKPIAVYAHIFAQSVSGATLLLPVNVLGKDYISINYTQLSNSETSEKKPSYSTFAVIGTEDNTTVEITPSTYLLNGEAPGKPFNIILNKGQVYQALANADLTGTRIRTISTQAGTCKKVALFSGSSKILIGCSSQSNTSDNLFQQVYPTASWGKNYITAPLKSRNYDVFRIVLSDPNTTVNLNGFNISPASFTNGLYYEFNSNATNVITADKPVQVVQYAVTQFKTINCIDSQNDIGDPEMIYLNPLEQTLDHVTLNSTSNYRILNNFINVVIPTGIIPTFQLDGKPYTQFTTVNGRPDYSYAQIEVDAGVHHIKASDGFNAIAYGFGQAESYGYAAGASLKNLNEFIALKDPQNTVQQLNGCTGVAYKIQLTLPFKTTHIKWDFENGAAFEDNNPVVKSTTVKGDKTLYLYEFAQSETYATAGDHAVIATVFNPVATECGSDEIVELDYNISAQPVAKFTVTGTCLGSATVFKDVSETADHEIKTWLWDFGDGTTDVVQNPLHTYTEPGNYPVRVTIVNENGCSDISDVTTVHISEQPLANFNFSAPDCPAQDITFTDASTSSDGAIIKWSWDFGDGSDVVQKTDNTPFLHQYAAPGVYNVKLIVTNSNGCASLTVEKQLTIGNFPVVDFILPDACVADNVLFKDNSTIADNTESEFTYEWNFGDSNASTINNTSAEKNPRHHYTEAKVYQVTLKVTSKYGCSYSKTQQVTINGDIPGARVVVSDPSALCSNREVFFENRSTVDFGIITRLEVTFDNNDAQSTKVYDHPAYGQQLRYTYPLFTDGNRTYNVHVVAYSGEICQNTQDFSLIIKPAHVITFAPTPSFCPEDAPFTFKPTNIQGPAGTGVYAGNGISTEGLFNPAVAGTGTTEISYIYSTGNTCPDTVKQQVSVYASPTASVEGPVTVLEGASVGLNASANGHNLTYKWTPAAGLDHDDVLSPQVSPSQATEYRLTVTSQEGCQATATVAVKVLKFLVIPNAFSPNGDGQNDTWDIKYLNQYPNNTVEIFNRYGEKVFTSVGYTAPWDGRYKGANLPEGTYYYIITPKNGRKTVSGNVTIIR